MAASLAAQSHIRQTAGTSVNIALGTILTAMEWGRMTAGDHIRPCPRASLC
ncbi:hypothetical protein [Sphingomonas cavernae]|uniref:hypothetical protein n=1 Tax=Sphingomonas cavernae TaxID=2320861 RepID=UPI0016018373|nr:hypothetical protein [Sphingomonas cavernae]